MKKNAVWALILVLISVAGANASARPNFIFVFADDLGWGDLGCYGHQEIKTPNLDKMAKEGLRLTNFYVNAPTCSPSRAAVMTSHFPSRHRIHWAIHGDPQINARRNMPNHLDPKLHMVTRLLQTGGYTTGHFGKWHLSGLSPKPKDYGIDVSKTKGLSTPTHAQSTENIINETIKFVEANRDKPFYVNTWLYDPHAPLNPTEEQAAPYEHMSPKQKGYRGCMQVYYSVITDIDRHVGRLMGRLKELGIDDNTVVVFSSDNGPSPIWGKNTSHSGAGSVGPFRGCKASLYEGGIREPFIVRWPGKTPTNVVDDTSIMSGVDLLPTFCSLAGVALPADLDPDGQDMSAVLLGKPMQRNKPLMWELRFAPWGRHIQRCPALAMRDGKWKLMMNPDGSRVELYDLDKNPCEVDSLADTNPDVVKRMSEQLLKWHKQLSGSDTIPDTAGSFVYPWPKSGDL